MPPSKPWFELTERDLPASTSFEALCPIVKPVGEGGTWKNLPTGIRSGNVRQFGWNSKDNTVSVLNPFALRHFSIGHHPEDFDLLFELEADASEREIAVREREKARDLVAARVIKFVRLVSTGTFKEPDPRTHAVVVHLSTSRLIDVDTDRGSIVLKETAPPLDKVRPSPDDMLRGDV